MKHKPSSIGNIGRPYAEKFEIACTNEGRRPFFVYAVNHNFVVFEAFCLGALGALMLRTNAGGPPANLLLYMNKEEVNST